MVHKNIINDGIKSLTDFYHTLSLEILQTKTASAYVTGVDSPFLNVVMTRHGHVAVAKQDRLQIKKFFAAHNAPWSFLVTPLTFDEHALHSTLLEEVPGLYFNLEKNLPPAIISPLLIINEVSAKDNLSTWVQAIREGFPTADAGEAYRKLNADLLTHPEKKSRLKHFIAFYEGQLATAATLFLSPSGVMLHNLATRNDFRKQGLGTALTLHMMHIAKKLGHRNCFLDSSSEGLNLYQKLGFKVCYTTKFYASD